MYVPISNPSQDPHALSGAWANLRYGCVILRHYLDIEKGNLFRALGRYNGSLGQARYPNLVRRKWQNDWKYVYGDEKLTTVSGRKPASESQRQRF